MPLRPLRSHERFRYRAIHDRPQYEWPGGKRLALYIGFNVEHFEFGSGRGARLCPSNEPDVLNHAWREYGNRVGAWRCLEIFDALGLPTGAIVNTSLYEHSPELLAALRERGDEFIAHGHTNADSQHELERDVERDLIADCRTHMTAAGTPPRGWLSPWIAESHHTPDLLAEQGFAYTLNWCHDDQPMPMRTAHGTLWSVPYPQEINDIPMIVGRQMDMPDFCRMIEDQFEEMLRQSTAQPLVMGIALHPYLVGQPHRLKHLRKTLTRLAYQGEAWWSTPGRILDHLLALPESRELEAQA